MFGEPFPKCSKWIDELAPARREEFEHFLYAVRYHLGVAYEAGRECSTPLYSFQWFPIQEQKAVILWGLRPELLIRNGDFAIRESASALDTGLQLTNKLLSLNVEKEKVRWGRVQNEGPMREQMRNVHGSSKLMQILDSIFGSIGYSLLQGYRNWVTHRGAPRLIVPQILNGPLPMPEEALKETEPSKRDWWIETHLHSLIPSEIQVISWPFVPPVQAIWSAKIDKAESDIELPGVHIGKGAQNITIENMRNAVGDLSMDAEKYKEHNKILLEESRTSVAGEDLATYTAIDYAHAVFQVVRFVEKDLTGVWDQELKQLCDGTA